MSSIPFDIESWIWYGIVIWICFSRFISRRLALGSFRAFQLDDYIMLLTICFYTTLVVTINIVAVTNSNLLPPDYDVAEMTQDDIDERVYGSKLILVVEECQCCVVWAAKACLLVMYMRFTVLARENLAIKVLAGYVAGGFVLMEILYLGVWCQPFWEYWAVPTDNVQCNAATNHLITNAVLNLTSDVAMLIIGLPIFIRVQVPLRQKIPLILLFSLGIFVIASAILNKIYSFSQPFGTDWVYWYVRESSTALIVANMPFAWALYRRLLGFGKSQSLTARSTPDDPHSPIQKRVQLRTVLHGKDSSPASDRASQESMTAEEWLCNDYMLSSKHTNMADINPYTHPAFYNNLAKKKRNYTIHDFDAVASAVQHVDRPSIIPEIEDHHRIDSERLRGGIV